MKNLHVKNISLLLLATIFISTSGVLGKYIDMSPEVIIWFRSIFAGVILFIYCKFKKVDLQIKKRKDLVPFVISAFLMAAHWITYFYALKISNVAIGMLSIYTFPVIIAFLEPLFIKTKFNPIHIFLGVLVLTGLYILTPELTFENADLKGILLGVFSAFCYAIRILILKQHIANYNGSMLMFYQTLIISILLLPLLFFGDFSNFGNQLPYLILLALITTAIGHTMLVHSLKHFSASTASIISSIQPISGIIIAYFILSETPNNATYIGGGLILLTVIIESFRSKK
ncbi:EamA family transporter [Polaribacter sp. SA4-10]|uniref:DMT family transporter n=1 Tax=Polaribacter sp. SA4-10 TaxID=754397 RepID=UPI000B3D0DA6|nr:DMT family transporter [Polaribacter sp. SA4-10]ARV07303.1 EamA family transporter [Polaribacter sp. SA4-10]